MKKIIFLLAFVIFNFSVMATVQPEASQLAEASTLIVQGKISKVETHEKFYLVTVSISKVEKGTPQNPKQVAYRYSKNEVKSKGDWSLEQFQKAQGQLKRFYLVKRDKSIVLADEWFGMVSLE